jgi:PIN domain nuclease of toxin-antitoxin system
MRFLVDTHVFLWFIAGDTRLSQLVRTAIEDDENTVLLSIASAWEIAIKVNVGKLTLAKPFADLIPEQIAENEIELLAITLDDLKVVATLPLHHRDPFDRLLIAQAMTQGIAIASDDASFAQYAVQVLW